MYQVDVQRVHQESVLFGNQATEQMVNVSVASVTREHIKQEFVWEAVGGGVDHCGNIIVNMCVDIYQYCRLCGTDK